MAIQGVMDARIFLGGFEYTGFSNELQSEYGAEMLDASIFGDATRINTAGLKTFNFTVGGFRDDADPSPFGATVTGYPAAEAFGRIGATREVFSFAPVGTADGDRAFTIRGVNATYQPLSGAVGELSPFEMQGRATHNELIRGVVEGVGTHITTFSSTGTQLGATSATQSLYAALHVTSFGGTTPTLDVIVESDDNSGFTTPTTQLTFTQVTEAVSAQWLEDVGPVTDDWWRITATIGGTTPTYDIFCVLGIGSLSSGL